MKTVKEISLERLLDRSTVLKAAQEGRIPARQSGATWLIDDESEQFESWLTSRKRRTFPPTIEAETPELPDWINTYAGKQAWKVNHEWRCDAASAEHDSYRQHLLREAERLYNR